MSEKRRVVRKDRRRLYDASVYVPASNRAVLARFRGAKEWLAVFLYGDGIWMFQNMEAVDLRDLPTHWREMPAMVKP